MKKKNAAALLAFGAMAAFAGTSLAGCGGGLVAAPSYLPDMELDTRGVTIDFWTGFGQEITATIETLISGFTERTGIIVNHTAQGGYDGLAQAINLSASSRSFPDVAVGYPDHFAGYRDSGIIMRLDQFIEHDGDIPATREGTATDKNAEGTFEELPAFDYDDFYADYKVENETIDRDQDGNYYTLGIPFNKSTEVMVYNANFFESDIVKEAGITLPETWEDLMVEGKEIFAFLDGLSAWNKVVTTDGETYSSVREVPKGSTVLLNLAAVNRDSFYPLGYDSGANLFITMVRQWGGTYTEANELGSGYVRFNSEQGKAAMEMLRDLAEEHLIAMPTTFAGTALYCSDYYTANRSVMNIGSSAGVDNCASSAFTSKTAPVLYHEGGDKYVISQGTNLAMFAGGTDEQMVASWKFIKYMSQQANGRFALLTGYFPTCGTAAEDPSYVAFMESAGTADSEGERLQRYAAVTNNDVYMVDENGWNKFVDPGFSGSSSIRTRVETIPNEVIATETSIEDILDGAYQSLRDYVEA